MLAAIRMTCSLLKLRIGVAVAASALAGMAAAKGPAISVAQASTLALAVLGASGAAGAFNASPLSNCSSGNRRCAWTSFSKPSSR